MAETDTLGEVPVEILSNGEIAEIESPTPIAEASPNPAPPASEPLPTPVLDRPRARATPSGTCSECGYVSTGEKDLKKHVHFKHTLAKARMEAQERKLAEARASASPPADFSDIPGQPASASSPIAVIPDQRFEGMANMTFDMTTGLLAKIFGPEWMPNADTDNPQVSHERMTVVEAIKKYYESMNLPDIPPGYMLCFVALAYAAPRMSAQPTRTKLQQAWLWLKTKFQRKKIGYIVK